MGDSQALQAILDSAVEGIITIDGDGVIHSFNSAAEPLFGRSASEMLGRNVTELMPVSFRSDHTGFIHRYLRTRVPRIIGSSARIDGLRADGSAFPMELSIGEFEHPQGGVRFVGICRDRTEQARAERLAVQSEERLAAVARMQAAVLGSVEHMVVATERDGTILTWNRSAERLLQWTADEMVGLQTPAVIHVAEEIAERAAELTQELGYPIQPGFEVFTAVPLLTGEAEVREWTMVRRDGTRFPMRLTVTVLLDDRGAMQGFVGLGRDISREQDARRQLVEARDAAEAASNAKSRFLANMSHELRTPLNAIIGYGELLIEDARGRQDAGQERDLERIVAAGDQLLDLVNGVLDLAKVEAGRMDLQVSSVDLTALVTEVIHIVQPAAEQRSNQLVTAVTPAPGFITDASRLRQVLQNLLANAVKFTQGGRVSVEAGPVGDEVVFAVQDTGIGMSEEQLERIFEPFVQADDSTTREYGGTGLGLAIVRRMVGLLGGTVTARSAPGQGARFEVRVPCKPPAP